MELDPDFECSADLVDAQVSKTYLFLLHISIRISISPITTKCAVNTIRDMCPLIHFALVCCLLSLFVGGESYHRHPHASSAGESVLSVNRSFALLKSFSHSSDITSTASTSRAMRAKSGFSNKKRIGSNDSSSPSEGILILAEVKTFSFSP